MTPERLAEIRQFAEAYKGSGLVRRRPNSAIAHRSELLAEVQRLTDELDCAQSSSDQAWTREHDLKAENWQLREDLANSAGHLANEGLL